MSASSHDRRRGRVTFPAPRGAAATLFTAFALASCVGAAFAGDVSLNALVTEVDKARTSPRGGGNLSSTLRVYVLEQIKRKISRA